MWLKVASSNNNPAFIARYFLSCVQEAGGMVLEKYGIMLGNKMILVVFVTLCTDYHRMSKVVKNRYGN